MLYQTLMSDALPERGPLPFRPDPRYARALNMLREGHQGRDAGMLQSALDTLIQLKNDTPHAAQGTICFLVLAAHAGLARVAAESALAHLPADSPLRETALAYAQILQDPSVPNQ